MLRHEEAPSISASVTAEARELVTQFSSDSESLGQALYQEAIQESIRPELLFAVLGESGTNRLEVARYTESLIGEDERTQLCNSEEGRHLVFLLALAFITFEGLPPDYMPPYARLLQAWLDALEDPDDKADTAFEWYENSMQREMYQLAGCPDGRQLLSSIGLAIDSGEQTEERVNAFRHIGEWIHAATATN